MSRNRRIQLAYLRELWTLYTNFQRPQLAPSTIKRDYQKVARVLEKIPDNLPTAIAIRDWLLTLYAAETTRRLIQQFNACCKWAVESDLIPFNPFEGLNKQIRRKVNDTAWTGFTALERDIIIRSFEAKLPFYAPWCKFLFWTGCRPEEAAALRWEHISPDASHIWFREAAPIDTKQRQSTKTWKSRRFPANDRLRNLLLSLKPSPPYPPMLVFTGEKGGGFEYHNFQTRQWKPMVQSLVDSGLVSLYLPQSHARHTFITLALDHLSVKDVAYLVGNSPEVIYKHYASRSRNILVPEF